MARDKGKRLAAIIPVEKLDQIEGLARRRLSGALQRKSRVPGNEADALADEAKHRARRKRKA